MGCQRFLGTLGDYLDGELGDNPRKELDRHIQNCPRCQIVCSTTRRTIELYRSLGPCPVPVEIESRLLAAIRMKAGSNGG